MPRCWAKVTVFPASSCREKSGAVLTMALFVEGAGVPAGDGAGSATAGVLAVELCSDGVEGSAAGV